MKYIYLTIHYTKSRASGHIIKAETLDEAKSIAIRHGIAHPFNSSEITSRHFRILDMCKSHNKHLIEKRKQDVKGKIWYEDKNGKLCKEKNG